MLRCEQQPICQETGTPVQRALGRDAGKLRKVIAFREMPENDISGLAVILSFKVGSRGLIGKVPHPGKHPLLDGPWVGTVAKHFQVVVGLKQQKINALKLGFYVGRDVTEVGGDGHAYTLSLKHEADGVRRVVGNGERADGDIANLKRLA